MQLPIKLTFINQQLIRQQLLQQHRHDCEEVDSFTNDRNDGRKMDKLHLQQRYKQLQIKAAVHTALIISTRLTALLHSEINSYSNSGNRKNKLNQLNKF